MFGSNNNLLLGSKDLLLFNGLVYKQKLAMDYSPQRYDDCMWLILTWICNLFEKNSFFQPWSRARLSKSSVIVVIELNNSLHNSSLLHIYINNIFKTCKLNYWCIQSFSLAVCQNIQVNLVSKIHEQCSFLQTSIWWIG